MNALSKQAGTLEASPFIAAKGMRKVLRRRAGAERCVPVDPARRSSRARRGQRRGKVDLHSHSRRARAAGRGRNPARREAFRRRLPPSCGGSGNELHPSGAGPRSGHDCDRKHHARDCRNVLGSDGWIGRLPRRRRCPSRAGSASTAPLDAKVKGLSTAENWLISITRALIRKSRLIVMDEPTAALSVAESDRLFEIVRASQRIWRGGALRLAPARRSAGPLPTRHRVPRRPLRRRAGRRRPQQTRPGRGDHRTRAGDRRGGQALAAGPGQEIVSRCATSRDRPGSRTSVSISARARCSASAAWSARGAASLPGSIFGADRAGERRHDARRARLSASRLLRRRQGGRRLRSGGAARRRAGSDEERRVQCRPRQFALARVRPWLPLSQHAAASVAG